MSLFIDRLISQNIGKNPNTAIMPALTPDVIPELLLLPEQPVTEAKPTLAKQGEREPRSDSRPGEKPFNDKNSENQSIQTETPQGFSDEPKLTSRTLTKENPKKVYNFDTNNGAKPLIDKTKEDIALEKSAVSRLNKPLGLGINITQQQKPKPNTKQSNSTIYAKKEQPLPSSAQQPISKRLTSKKTHFQNNNPYQVNPSASQIQTKTPQPIEENEKETTHANKPSREIAQSKEPVPLLIPTTATTTEPIQVEPSVPAVSGFEASPLAKKPFDASSSSFEEPTITVKIGTIEVHGVTRQKHVSKSRPPALSLRDYLRQRSEGNR